MSSSNGGLYKILSRVYAPAIFSLTHSTSSSRENHYRANMSKPKFTPLRLGDSLTSNWGLHVTHNTFLHSLLSYPRDDGDSSRFLKQFETLKLLGMGGFGFVCEVMSFSDLNKYAIKVIPLYLEDEVQEESVLQEVQCMARIGQHQNIVKLYSAWVEHITDNLSTHFHDKLGINNLTNGLISSQSVISDYSTSNSSELKNEANYLLFIQLELCSSLTLRNVLDSRCDYLAYSDLLRIFTEISIAVNHVHDQEFVHRDIKPENVYFKDQVAKLGDFGLAYCLNLASRAGTDPQAKSVDIAGTPLYVAPDKIQSKASDVYSMGILLFEMMEIFSTQMERSIAVGELKMGRISEKIASRYPGISKLLLSMVNPESSNRPSTQSILDSLSHLSPI